MTSSETSPTPPVRVLAQGHLHPGMLFVRFVDGLRQSLLPIIISVVLQELWLAAATAVFFLLGLGWSVARYVSFQYRLTEDELVTTEGILHRQERRIPVDRIQDLGFEANLLRRMIGLVVVSVETASGQGVEARLDSLGRSDAIRLREVLMRIRGRATGTEQELERPARRLYQATMGELILLGMTNNRIGAILLAIFGAIEILDQFGASDQVSGVAGGAVEQLTNFAPLVTIAIIAVTLFVFLLGGWMLSVGASLVLYHGFVLSERDDVFQRRFGLLTTRTQSLPRPKIQRVLLEASPLRRLLGAVTMRADSAGSGGGDQRSGPRIRDLVVPMTGRRRGEALVPWLLRGMRAEPLPWQRVSSRVVTRTFMKGVLLTAVLLAVGLPSIGLPALLATICLPAAFGIGFLLYRNLGWARQPGHVAFRWGILGRYRAYIPLRKVQGVVLRAGPLDRSLGLATLTVYVAGGSPTTLGDLPREQAEWLKEQVSREAAQAPFVW